MPNMLLSRPDILSRIQSGNIRFNPELSDDAIKECSVDLRLAPIFSVFKKKEHSYIAALRIHDAAAAFNAPDLWDQQQRDRWTLQPGEFVLSQTLERVQIPNDLMGLVEGRSSWARFGISVHVTAPKIDPGFSAPITLELTNHGNIAIELIANEDRPCQLMFLQLSTPLEHGYKTSGALFADQTKPIPTKTSK
ncbi:MAG: dCTP deaminase [Candidatus Binataceae bacterium]|nr:dCTP deaminase [Candidatus Binataceae bacterium]